MTLVEGFFALVLVFLLVALVAASQINSRRVSMSQALKALHSFTATQVFVGTNGNSGLAVDEVRSSLCLLTTGTPSSSRSESFALTREDVKTETRVIPFRDLLACEILEDGAAITKTSRGSQVVGAAVGGLLLGGMGALIGGLSGSTTTRQKVSSVLLRLTVNDTAQPIHEVYFFGGSGDAQFSRTNPLYKKAHENAQRWHALIRVLIERADREAEVNAAPKDTTAVAPLMVADELAKLNDLRVAGVLSDAEFAAQKARLLG